MRSQFPRLLITAALLFGAVVFGMVLAGGLDWTPAGQSAENASGGAEASSAVAPPGGLPGFADLAEQVSPAVVSIDAASFESARFRGRRPTDPFEFFFGPRFRQEDEEEEEEDREFRSDSGGSGFIISADGLVITNYHVIRGAEQVQVHMGETAFEAEVKGSDPATDLALLKIEPDDDLPYLPLGDSDSLRVGDWVMAIGNPFQLENTVTVGVVSAKGRRINISQETSSFEDFIQTDAAINFGNSGGPLVNLSGEVVGINTAINYGAENVGFAVPVNLLKRVLPQLSETGRVRRGYLGIEVQDVTAEAAEAFGLEKAEGALVMNVLPNLPAAKGGLEAGDVIVKVDQAPVTNTRDLINYVSAQGPDAEVVVEILRNGERQTKKIELAERPGAEGEVAAEEEEEESGIEWLGIRYQDLTSSMKSSHGIPDEVEGVWITEVSPRSPLWEDGIRTGNVINVITEVNGREVSGSDDFEDVIRGADSGSRLRLYIRRFVRGDEVAPLFVFPAVP